MNALISLCEKCYQCLSVATIKLDYVGTSIQLVGPKYEHSIRATLNAAAGYGPVFMHCIAMFYVPFHTGLGIIKFISLLQQFVSKSRK